MGTSSTRTLLTLVAGLGAVVVLASGAQASAPPRAAPSSKRRPSAAPRKPSSSASAAPKGEVTLGPITRIITDPKTGKVTRKTDDGAPAIAKKFSPYELLTDEQAAALEEDSVQSARASLPGAGATQQELARRAAIRARELMSRKGVPPIPKTPANPNVDTDAEQERGDVQPRAYVSPPTPINLELARREAPTLAKHLRSKGISGYSRQSVRDFQAHAGITVDGIYGPLSASALKYFGVANPPKAFFKPKVGTVTIYAPAN